MKYCLSATQSKEYLQKADEILIKWKDKDFILDFLKINEKASVVLAIDLETILTETDWDIVSQYNNMLPNRFKLCLTRMNYGECKKRNIPFFFAMAVDNAWTLNALINLGVCAARITGQLTHQLDYINTLPIEIRVWANNPGAPFGYESLLGGWFRPEDLYNLEAIDVCEFDAKDNRQEQALYRIYAERHEWPGELYLIIKDIQDTTITNRMIPPEFQERRSNCRMKCQSGSQCHYCKTITSLANPELLRPLKDKIEKEDSHDRII